MVNNEEKKPTEYDLVLGGNNPPNNALVLGGIEGVKSRFNQAKSDNDKIAILKEALKYNQAGEEFLSNVFCATEEKIKWMAAVFISLTKNEVYQQILVDYFADIMSHHLHKWNSWKQTDDEIKIYLKKLSFNTQTKLINRNLSNCDLTEADLSCIYLSRCDFSNTNLYKANFSSSYLDSSILVNTQLIKASIFATTFQEATLINVDFSEASLVLVNFKFAKLQKITFENNTLDGINFKNAFLHQMKFNNIIFNNNSMTINKRRKHTHTNFIKATLEDVIFENCEINDISFTSAILKQVVFRRCNLANANFHNCDLRGTVFEEVNLRNVDFRGANLMGVDFTELDVSDANFTRCILSNNNLEKTTTTGAKFNSLNSSEFPLYDLIFSELKEALFDDRYYEEGIDKKEINSDIEKS